MWPSGSSSSTYPSYAYGGGNQPNYVAVNGMPMNSTAPYAVPIPQSQGQPTASMMGYGVGGPPQINTYGQPMSTYGNQSMMYGQQPMMYGQQPMMYGQPPPPVMYGQQQPMMTMYGQQPNSMAMGGYGAANFMPYGGPMVPGTTVPTTAPATGNPGMYQALAAQHAAAMAAANSPSTQPSAASEFSSVDSVRSNVRLGKAPTSAPASGSPSTQGPGEPEPKNHAANAPPLENEVKLHLPENQPLPPFDSTRTFLSWSVMELDGCGSVVGAEFERLASRMEVQPAQPLLRAELFAAQTLMNRCGRMLDTWSQISSRMLAGLHTLPSVMSNAQRLREGLQELVNVVNGFPGNGASASRSIRSLITGQQMIWGYLKTLFENSLQAYEEASAAPEGTFRDHDLVDMQHLIRAQLLQMRFRDMTVELRSSKYSKSVRMRLNVLREIVSSEESYVKNLKIAHENYYLPLMVDAAKSKPLVTRMDVMTIFQSLEMILEFNSSFLEKLRSRQKQWPTVDRVGDIFLEVAPFLNLYFSYVNGYEHSAEYFAALLQKSSAFSQRMAELKNLSGSSLTLDSLLIMPVQRLPRYELLLRDLLKHTEEIHGDHANLVAAMESIKKVNHYINEKKRHLEAAAHILQLDASIQSLPFRLAEPSRVFVKEYTANISRRSGDVYFPVKIFLFKDLLLFVTSNRRGLFYSAHISLEPSPTLVEGPDVLEISDTNSHILIRIEDPIAQLEFANAVKKVN